MTEPAHDPQTTDVEKPAVEPDTQSDPSLDDGSSTDWSSEGGAATEGPATDTDNDDVP